jgi:hypothetical protein
MRKAIIVGQKIEKSSFEKACGQIRKLLKEESTVTREIKALWKKFEKEFGEKWTADSLVIICLLCIIQVIKSFPFCVQIGRQSGRKIVTASLKNMKMMEFLISVGFDKSTFLYIASHENNLKAVKKILTEQMYDEEVRSCNQSFNPI